jgi:methyl-accepting chemotaxis protein
VNIAVTEMDKVTQQTAANSEETASASEELSAQAQELNSIVRQLAFIVNGTADESGSMVPEKSEAAVEYGSRSQKGLPKSLPFSSSGKFDYAT